MDVFISELRGAFISLDFIWRKNCLSPAQLAHSKTFIYSAFMLFTVFKGFIEGINHDGLLFY